MKMKNFKENQNKSRKQIKVKKNPNKFKECLINSRKQMKFRKKI